MDSDLESLSPELQYLALVPQMGDIHQRSVGTMEVVGGFTDGATIQDQRLQLRAREGLGEGTIDVMAKTAIAFAVGEEGANMSLTLRQTADGLQAMGSAPMIMRFATSAVDDTGLRVETTGPANVAFDAQGHMWIGKTSDGAQLRFRSARAGADEGDLGAVITERAVDAADPNGSTELLLGKLYRGAPDPDSTSPDRIRHVAGAHVFQSYASQWDPSNVHTDAFLSQVDQVTTTVFSLVGTEAIVDANATFSIDSVSERGGRLVVTEEGRLGVGVATPTTDIHFRGDMLVEGGAVAVQADEVQIGKTGAEVELQGNVYAQHLFAGKDVRLADGCNTHQSMHGTRLSLPSVVDEQGGVAQKGLTWLNGPNNTREDAVYSGKVNISAKWVFDGGDLCLRRMIRTMSGNTKNVAYVFSIDDNENLVLVKTGDLLATDASQYRSVARFGVMPSTL